MVRADVEPFRGLSAYCSGIAAILDAGERTTNPSLEDLLRSVDQVLRHLRTRPRARACSVGALWSEWWGTRRSGAGLAWTAHLHRDRTDPVGAW
jgi:hypothetical protein